MDWKLTNEVDRAALAEASWLLAAAGVSVTVRNDYQGSTFRRDEATGMSRQVGVEHKLDLRFQQGRASVDVRLKGAGVYLRLRSLDEMRIGRSVIAHEILRALYDRRKGVNS